ncbi:MAG: type II toxin-antitoxin system PemK/MazF family toxin [Salinibacterium sp.]|jgi:mRNA interferase MazF|nr:type II toxin-antitoxin system PemK/MazF family toxin [Micrococcales bacterium]MCB1281482.1 type II toxin-antitoxin system PemK/MazF family toxin [Salinibacterium sp.]
MVIEHGGIYWAELGPAVDSRPAKRRPVLVIQSNSYNESHLATVLVAVITTNTALATMPGNVFLAATATGLPHDSVANVTAIVTLNKADLADYVGQVPDVLLEDVHRGLRRVLEL